MPTINANRLPKIENLPLKARLEVTDELAIENSTSTPPGNLSRMSALDIITSLDTMGIASVNTTYNIAITDRLILCAGGSYTVTLPDATAYTAGEKHKIINIGTGIITIATTAGQKISGIATRTIGLQYSSLTVVSDGSNWLIEDGFMTPFVAHGTYTDNTTQAITSTTVPWAITFDTTEDEAGVVHDLTTHQVTISNASPAVIGWTGHGLFVDSPVVFSVVGGTLPTGITAGTTYYVISAGFGSNSFEISATPKGTAINTSSAGSGTFYAKNTSRFTFNTPGDFEISYSAIGYAAATDNTYIDIWYRKNGSDIVRSNTRAKIAAATTDTVIASYWLGDFAVGDTIELFWAGSSTNNRLLTTAANTNPTRPASPSVVLIIKKISI